MDGKKVFMKDDWIEGTVGGTRAMMIDSKGELKCERKQWKKRLRNATRKNE